MPHTFTERKKNQFPKPYCWYKHKHDFKFNLLSPFFGANKFDHREMNAINFLPPETNSIGLVLCSTWTKSLTFRSQTTSRELTFITVRIVPDFPRGHYEERKKNRDHQTTQTTTNALVGGKQQTRLFLPTSLKSEERTTNVPTYISLMPSYL